VEWVKEVNKGVWPGWRGWVFSRRSEWARFGHSQSKGKEGTKYNLVCVGTREGNGLVEEAIRSGKG